jgi:hypothetical protein
VPLRRIPCGTVPHAARHPTRHGSPRGTVSHAARYPTRHGIPRPHARVRVREGWHPAPYGSTRTPAPPLILARCTAVLALARATLHFAIVCCAIQASRRERSDVAHIEAELRRRARAHPAHICTGTSAPGRGLTPPTSAPGPGSPRPHLHQDWAHPAHICTRTASGGRTAEAPTAAQHRDVASVKLCIAALPSVASLRRRTPQRCIVAPLLL